MTVQQHFSRKDLEAEGRRRRVEAEEAELRALTFAPRHLAVKRDEVANLALLELFTDIQSDLEPLDVLLSLHGVGLESGPQLRRVLRSLGPRLDDQVT
jgi:hypothetical protein